MKRLMTIISLMFTCSLSANDFNATLVWADKVTLGSPLSALVTQVAVKSGQFVKKGDLLISLDNRALNAKFTQALSHQKRVNLEKQEASRELERTMDLYERTLISEHERQLTEIADAQARSEWITSQTQLTIAKLNVGYSQITAPFDARVLDIPVTQGQMVVNQSVSTPLIILARKGKILARSYVSLTDVAGLKIGQLLSVKVGGGIFQGTLNQIHLKEESNLAYIDIIFDHQGDLIAGQKANILF